MLEFKKDVEVGKFYDPGKDEVNEEEIEIRYDPLTGKPSRIIKKPFPISPDPDFKDDVKKKGFCPFCPESIDDVGARDVRILSRKIIRKGEAALLANITPYSKYSLVIRLTEEHYLPLDKFDKIQFADALELASHYIREVMRDDDESNFNIIMNYLKPAGSSIVHPHIQIIGSGHLLDYQKRQIDNAIKYKRENNTNYWRDLTKEEENGDRFIGKTGPFKWISAFAPRGFEHVKGISETKFIEYGKNDLKELGKGITNVLKAYNDMGYNSFNFSIFMSPSSESDCFATVIDMLTRSNLDKFYWCDVFAITKLNDEAYSNKTPEEIAENISSYF